MRAVTRFWTPANAMSLSRLPLAAAVWIDPGRPALLLPLMAAAAVTDVLDGWLARRSGAERGVGAWLDPLCDKAFILSALAALCVAHRPPAHLILLTAARELLQLPLYLLFRFVPPLRPRAYDFRAALVGKAATAAQVVTVAAVVFKASWTFESAAVTAALGVAAVAVYVRRAFTSKS